MKKLFSRYHEVQTVASYSFNTNSAASTWSSHHERVAVDAEEGVYSHCLQVREVGCFIVVMESYWRLLLKLGIPSAIFDSM